MDAPGGLGSVCSNCGSQIQSAMAHCRQCGTPVNRTDPIATEPDNRETSQTKDDFEIDGDFRVADEVQTDDDFALDPALQLESDSRTAEDHRESEDDSASAEHLAAVATSVPNGSDETASPLHAADEELNPPNRQPLPGPVETAGEMDARQHVSAQTASTPKSRSVASGSAGLLPILESTAGKIIAGVVVLAVLLVVFWPEPAEETEKFTVKTQASEYHFPIILEGQQLQVGGELWTMDADNIFDLEVEKISDKAPDGSYTATVSFRYHWDGQDVAAKVSVTYKVEITKIRTAVGKPSIGSFANYPVSNVTTLSAERVTEQSAN